MDFSKKLNIDEILDELSNLSHIRPEDIPNIDLYMDQVTTFMDQYLSRSKRYTNEKTLTKTMINNYAKNHLLPPPNKKKYSKEHLLLLIFIYYFKNILSISDIQKIFTPICSEYFNGSDNFKLEDIYNQVFELEENQINSIKEDIRRAYGKSQETFTDNKDGDFLQVFSFICILSFDIYIKKQIIENMIDSLFPTKLDPSK